MPSVTTTSVTNIEGSNTVIVRTTRMHREYPPYAWLLLGLLAAVLIVAGLRKLFWTTTSN